jgi:uncharacterized membrane protein YidH (DUF202 family)
VELRDYLAAERALLAWIRTGLALMGFGFVVARFGLFLQQLQIAQHAPSMQPYGLSLWFGTALLGHALAQGTDSVAAILRPRRTLHRFDTQTPSRTVPTCAANPF